CDFTALTSNSSAAGLRESPCATALTAVMAAMTPSPRRMVDIIRAVVTAYSPSRATIGISMSFARIAPALAVLLAACSRPAERSASPQPEATAKKEAADAMPQHLLTPEPERTFVDGPPIDPPDALLKWLETTASTEPRPRIRLPVVVRFRDQHRLGLDGGHIGVSPAALPGVIQVTLDDTAMGIALIDRVRNACPDA